MYTYENDELTHKIHTFLNKKSQRFPQITIKRPLVRKIRVHEESKVAIVSLFETLNTQWLQRLRSL